MDRHIVVTSAISQKSILEVYLVTIYISISETLNRQWCIFAFVPYVGAIDNQFLFDKLQGMMHRISYQLKNNPCLIRKWRE